MISTGKCTPTNILLVTNKIGQIENSQHHLKRFFKKSMTMVVMEKELDEWPEKKL